MIMLDKYTSRTAYWRFRAITDWLVYLCLSLWQINSRVWPALSENYPLSSITDLNDTNFTHIQIHSDWAIRHLKIELRKINEWINNFELIFFIDQIPGFGEVPIVGTPLMSMHWNQIVPMYPWGHLNQWASLHLWTFWSNLFSSRATSSVLSIRFFFTLTASRNIFSP